MRSEELGVIPLDTECLLSRRDAQKYAEKMKGYWLEDRG